MEYNLLQKSYDIQCDLFINGFIDLETFMEMEEKYIMMYKLFTINLN